MNKGTVAIIINEGGKLISEIIRNRPKKRVAMVEPSPIIPAEETTIGEEKATSVEAGCVPCAIGHLGTCSGGMNEAVRFAKKDGVSSSEVIDRVNMCLDELNIMERVDLRPEMIVNLSEWERELANKALVASRNVRHRLEGLTSARDLEQIAANIQTTRTEIGRKWFQERLAKMSPEEKENIAEKAIAKLEDK